MKKIISSILLIAVIVSGVYTTGVDRAQAVTLSELTELFIALDIIPADKAEEARNGECPTANETLEGLVECYITSGVIPADRATDARAVIQNQDGSGEDSVPTPPTLDELVELLIALEIVPADNADQARAVFEGGGNTPTSFSELIELFITLEIIPADKIDDARALVENEVVEQESNSSNGITVEALSTYANVNMMVGGVPTGEFDYTVKFDVTALEDTIYISDIPSYSVDFQIENSFGDDITAPYSVLDRISLTSTASKEGNAFRINEGDTETFTFTVAYNPAEAEESYRLQLNALKYGTSVSNSSNFTYSFTPEENFETPFVSLVGSDNGVSEQGPISPTKLFLSRSPNNPEDSIIHVDNNEAVENVMIFAFGLASSDSDVTIKEIPVHLMTFFPSSHSSTYENIIDNAVLEINGIEYSPSKIGMFAEYDDISTRVLTFNFGDGVHVEKDTFVEAKLRVDLKPIEGNYHEGTYIRGYLISQWFDKIKAVDESGVAVLAEGRNGIEPHGNHHSLYSQGVVAEIVSTGADRIEIDENSDQGLFELKYDVTAFGGDALIALNASPSWDDKGSVKFFILDQEGKFVNVSSSTQTLSSPTAVVEDGYFQINDGDTHTLIFTVNFTPESSGNYRLEQQYLSFSKTKGGEVFSVMTSPIEDFTSPYVFLKSAGPIAPLPQHQFTNIFNDHVEIGEEVDIRTSIKNEGGQGEFLVYHEIRNTEKNDDLADFYYVTEGITVPKGYSEQVRVPWMPTEAGVYTISLGVYSPSWSLYQWTNNVGLIYVDAQTFPSSTSTDQNATSTDQTATSTEQTTSTNETVSQPQSNGESHHRRGGGGRSRSHSSVAMVAGASTTATTTGAVSASADDLSVNDLYMFVKLLIAFHIIPAHKADIALTAVEKMMAVQ